MFHVLYELVPAGHCGVKTNITATGKFIVSSPEFWRKSVEEEM